MGNRLLVLLMGLLSSISSCGSTGVLKASYSATKSLQEDNEVAATAVVTSIATEEKVTAERHHTPQTISTNVKNSTLPFDMNLPDISPLANGYVTAPIAA